eukprot:TRINITY_DN32776_c0_g1_i1.p1 TRINITY_DN32776_c0_g1~~TRINITY_DN32776_c0_g1_i1.p1  ORF type:complete len:220 (+),score=42.71 TRINITY_DN32776_c0_g1_i1:138-797(+)
MDSHVRPMSKGLHQAGRTVARHCLASAPSAGARGAACGPAMEPLLSTKMAAFSATRASLALTAEVPKNALLGGQQLARTAGGSPKRSAALYSNVVLGCTSKRAAGPGAAAAFMLSSSVRHQGKCGGSTGRPVKSALKNRWLPQRTLCSGVCFDTENVEIYEVSPRASKAALDLAVPPVPDDWLSSLQLGSDSSYDDKVAMEAAAALACVFQGALIPRPL